MAKLSITDLELKNKKVLMRVDFNVPLKEDGSIADDERIKAALPSIKYVLEQGGSLILMSHLGKPKGKFNPKFSLLPCAKRLQELLKHEVFIAPDCIGTQVEEMAKNLRPNEILMLENLRFYAAEEDPTTDPSFAEKLAKLGDLYVNDAFGTAHRAHSSTATICRFFPGKAAAGFLMEKEIKFLKEAFEEPKRPFFAIIGGAKISSKIGVVKKLIEKVDALFIGGGMTYTFLKAANIAIGKSICENDQLNNAEEIKRLCQEKNIPLHLPSDLTITESVKEGAPTKIISTSEGIPPNWEGVDIGPQTIREWSLALKKAKTVFWNGPLGIFEVSTFATGTNAIAQTLASLKTNTIVGGGDSVAAINNLNLREKFTHLSTGGGASLEYIELGHLPGIDALSDKSDK